MKKITKDNRGITLIVLITTVILMLILLSVGTYSGIDAYKTARVNKFVTQMQLLQAKIDDLYDDEIETMKLSEITTNEQRNTITVAFANLEITTSNTDSFKVFTKEQILNYLEIDNAENDILVNFETREILDTVGIEYKGKTYYTQYKLPGGQKTIQGSSSQTRDLSFDINESLDGLNCTITIPLLSRGEKGGRM